MRRYVLFLFTALLAVGPSLFAQENPKDLGLNSITEQSLQAQLEFLASDWTTGRDAGTVGEFMAADYIASLFKMMGLRPGGDREYRLTGRSGSRSTVGTFGNRSWFQNFNLLETRAGAVQNCRLTEHTADGYRAIDLGYQVDYTITPGTITTVADAPLVFVGYGLSGGKNGFDDYKKLNVKGKVIVRLAGFPGWREPGSKNYKKFGGQEEGRMVRIERMKDSIALAMGAVGVIDIRPGALDNFQSPSNLPFRYNQDNYEGDEPFRPAGRVRLQLAGKSVSTGLTRITLSQRILNTILANCNMDPAEYEKVAASSQPKGNGHLGGYSLQFASTVDSRWIRVRNVIGILEGEDTENCIVIGAHYDHVGQVRGFIYNGADDNASGTVGVLSIARAMVASGVKPKTTVVFCAWTSEEKGLLGSAYYADNPVIRNIRCYMNYDMISRTAPDDPSGMKCDFNYSSGMPVFRELTEKHIERYDLRLDMAYQSSPTPVGGSDFSSFSVKGIPIFLIHGKFTPDYHQFTDHADKAVMPYFADIVRLGYLNIFELANNYKW